jgi:uncharacterized protein YyaL (SSP411 family)
VPGRLTDSLSPYLAQHADNPVDWWPWGPDAFDEARRRDVPVFLSVGYAACHWCHVMAHESFEDPTIAQYLNDNFVSVKVDREEHPDVDAAYMAATVALTGRGGWPMSVWLDHDARAFYAGTYYPPRPRMGMPSFGNVLRSVQAAWTQQRDRVELAAEQIAAALTARAAADQGGGTADLALVSVDAVNSLLNSFDAARGGFGAAPKFPPSMVLEFLLRRAGRVADPRALQIVESTCEAMARGGMYDQLGGGFARYSVDADWVVPHFEKMLYDNALLLRVYLHWWRLTGSELAARVVDETAEFLLRDMVTPEGGLASSLDADSVPEGAADAPAQEGASYVWTRAQLAAALGATDGAWVADLCGVTTRGTFESGGRSTLQLRRDPDDAARWQRVRRTLFEARDSRPAPARDDKVVAAWNGLAIAALADAGALMSRPEWTAAAERAADLLVARHLCPDGRLLRVSRGGAVGAAPGVLEDYADVAAGLLSLYQATGETAWFDLAGSLLGAMLTRFTGGDSEDLRDAEPSPLLAVQSDPTDNAYPAGGSAAMDALLTWLALGANAGADLGDLRERVHRTVASRAELMRRQPRFAGQWLSVAEALLAGPPEVAIVGDPAAPASAELVATARRSPTPGVVIAVGAPGDRVPPLLADRPVPEGAVACAYVCRASVCDAPVSDPADLRALLDQTAKAPEHRVP